MACRKFLSAFKRAGFSLMVPHLPSSPLRPFSCNRPPLACPTSTPSPTAVQVLFSGVFSDIVQTKQRLAEDIKAMRQLVRRRGRHSGKMLPLFAQDVLLQVLHRSFPLHADTTGNRRPFTRISSTAAGSARAVYPSENVRRRQPARHSRHGSFHEVRRSVTGQHLLPPRGAPGLRSHSPCTNQGRQPGHAGVPSFDLFQVPNIAVELPDAGLQLRVPGFCHLLHEAAARAAVECSCRRSSRSRGRNSSFPKVRCVLRAYARA